MHLSSQFVGREEKGLSKYKIIEILAKIVGEPRLNASSKDTYTVGT